MMDNSNKVSDIKDFEKLTGVKLPGGDEMVNAMDGVDEMVITDEEVSGIMDGLDAGNVTPEVSESVTPGFRKVKNGMSADKIGKIIKYCKENGIGKEEMFKYIMSGKDPSIEKQKEVLKQKAIDERRKKAKAAKKAKKANRR